MKACKFCGNMMMGEFETNSQNSRKFKAFYICHKCGAICDGEYEESKNGRKTIREKWYEPKKK